MSSSLCDAPFIPFFDFRLPPGDFVLPLPLPFLSGDLVLFSLPFLPFPLDLWPLLLPLPPFPLYEMVLGDFVEGKLVNGFLVDVNDSFLLIILSVLYGILAYCNLFLVAFAREHSATTISRMYVESLVVIFFQAFGMRLSLIDAGIYIL